MKRIVVYSTQLMATGGIESHLLEFCKQMSERGILINLVVLNSNLLPETEQFYNKYCNEVYLGKQGRSFFRILWLLIVTLKLRLRRIDALYTNGQGESINLFKTLLKVRGPWVHHHHTSGDTEDQKTWGNNYLKALAASDTVIACSIRNARDMALYLNRPVDSIPCFSRKITPGQVPIKADGKVRFGYYGRLIPEKGIDILCKLSQDSDLPNVEFHIWGKGEAYDNLFFQKFPNIYYHGSFSGLTELTKTIAAIDAFVLISVHPEGLPICLLEAMSAGLPWLATDRGGISDIACDPLSTRVIPYDSSYDQVKHAIQLFAEDIAQGKISKDVQEQLYDEKFSAATLVRRWSEALNI